MVAVAKVTAIENGKTSRVEWRISESKLKDLPSWRLGGKSPLSLEESIRISHDHLTKQFPEVKDWVINSASLMSIKDMEGSRSIAPDNYYYLILLTPPDTDESAVVKFYQVVLMDGTLVTPHLHESANLP